jgi:hypothetical protein
MIRSKAIRRFVLCLVALRRTVSEPSQSCAGPQSVTGITVYDCEIFVFSTTAWSQIAGTLRRIRTASHTYLFERTSDEKKALNSIEGSIGPTFGNNKPHRFRVCRRKPE